MVISNLYFEVYPSAFKLAKARKVFLIRLNFQEKQGFSQNGLSPTNWGAGAILLPPVVDFKKILQESYANDNPE
jgi:hypothetical protein